MLSQSRAPGWDWKASSTSTKQCRSCPQSDGALPSCLGLPNRYVTAAHHSQKHREHFAVVEIPGIKAAHQYAYDYGDSAVQYPAFAGIRRKAAQRAREIEDR